MVVDIPDIITYANFGEDRLRGLGWRGSNLPFSIDFDRRPYNTLALPCECVMSVCLFAVACSACSGRRRQTRRRGGKRKRERKRERERERERKREWSGSGGRNCFQCEKLETASTVQQRDGDRSSIRTCIHLLYVKIRSVCLCHDLSEH